MFLLLALSVTAVSIDGLVNDEANVLTKDEERELEGVLRPLYDAGVAQYAVVTVPSLEGRDVEGYAFDLAEGVLGEREKNNGLLLLVAIEDRKYRFEVGRGLEPVLPDIVVGRIGREFLVPHFREGNYAAGILEASRAVSAKVQNETESSYYVAETQGRPNAAVFLLSFLLVIIIIGVIFSALAGGGRSDGDYFLTAWAASQMMRGGGVGGGFGGFGGGGFGGGGASGGW